MMFEILEPCRVLRLGTSSQKYICKINKNHDKNKNRKEKNEMNEMEKRTKGKRREQTILHFFFFEKYILHV